MKTITKILLTTVVTLIPLGIFAQETFEEHEYFDDKVSKHFKHSDDKKESLKQYMIKKGVNYSFEGKLQSKPKNGLNGLWMIDDIEVVVNDKTFIKQSKQTINVGDEIEIKAKRVDNKIIVIILEQEDGFFE